MVWLRFQNPAWAARWELGQAAFDLVRWMPSLAWYLAVSHDRHEAEVARDLAQDPVTPILPAAPLHWTRPPRLFVSSAEVSGEVHACNLVQALRQVAREADLPEPRIVGFGGAALRDAGVEILGDPVAEATLQAKGILRALPFYVNLIRRAGERFVGEQKVDLFVPVDSPALHVPMARMAHRMGVATWHFIAPQFWGWAPWRVGRYRAHVERALTILPFEPHWYARHRVPALAVGHPLLDELQSLPAPPAPDHPDRRGWVLLPGSRKSEIEDNLRWMLRAVEPLQRMDPRLPITIAQNRPDHREVIEGLLREHRAEHPGGVAPELAIGDLHGTLARARGALAVSGTVLTDLLWHRLPVVVIYRDPGGWKSRMAQRLLTCRWFASTNLIAGEPIVPEYVFSTEGPIAEVGEDLVRLHTDEGARGRMIAGLERAWQRLGGPGACERAARALLARASRAPEGA